MKWLLEDFTPNEIAECLIKSIIGFTIVAAVMIGTVIIF